MTVVSAPAPAPLSSPPPCTPGPCSQQLDKLRGEVRAIVAAPKHCLPFLQPGRLVRVLPPEQPQQQQAQSTSQAAAAAASSSSRDGGGGSSGSGGVLAVVVNFERVGKAQREGQQQDGGSSSGGSRGSQYLVDVLVNCSEDSLRHQGGKR